MCNCISEIREKITEKYPTFKGKRVIKVSANTALIIHSNTIKEVFTNDFSLEIEGLKKKQTIPVTHSYCPFCGVEYEKTKE